MKRTLMMLLAAVSLLLAAAGGDAAEPTIAGHTVVLDGQGKIIPWSTQAEKAYSGLAHQQWNLVKTKVPPSPGPPPRSDYPQYYFYDGYVTKEAKITPDNWMNNIGEKIPNWFESARLYYAYTGDAEVMAIVRKLCSYDVLADVSYDAREVRYTGRGCAGHGVPGIELFAHGGHA